MDFSRTDVQESTADIWYSVSRLVMTRVTVRYAGHTGRQNSGYRQYKVRTQCVLHMIQGTYNTRYIQYKVQTMQGTCYCGSDPKVEPPGIPGNSHCLF